LRLYLKKQKKMKVKFDFKLKQVNAGYFFNGKYPIYGSIFFVRRTSDPKVFDGPYALSPDHFSKRPPLPMRNLLDQGLIWAKDHSEFEAEENCGYITNQ